MPKREFSTTKQENYGILEEKKDTKRTESKKRKGALKYSKTSPHRRKHNARKQ